VLLLVCERKVEHATLGVTCPRESPKWREKVIEAVVIIQRT